MIQTLEFPNPTRSFDKVRNGVHFVGYDNMVPISFLIEASALSRSKSEFDCLTSFDSIVVSIHKAARKIHSRKKSHTHTLTTLDF